MKIDAIKLREQLKASGKQNVTILFPEQIDLASVARSAADAGAEYIEISGLASSTNKNNYGFQIAAAAWKKASAFARIGKNPMVLFNHNSDFPLGQIMSWQARSEGLWVTLRLRYNVVLPTQERLGDVVKDGTLKALSVRIEINEFEVVETGDSVDVVVTDCTIGEISLCAVPSDADAVCDESYIATLSSVYKLASITDEKPKGGSTMWKLLAQKFGMDPAQVTEEQVMAEYNRRESLGASAIVGLGLDPNNFTAEALTAALKARDPQKLIELTQANAKLTAQGLVNDAIHQHKIAENDEPTKTWALGYAEKDPDGFKAWVALQKATKPNTQRVTGSGATLGGGTDNDETPYITKEDREVCLKFGKFTDPAKMDEMAEVTPNVALGWVLGDTYPATAKDLEIIGKRRALDTACGIQAR